MSVYQSSTAYQAPNQAAGMSGSNTVSGSGFRKATPGNPGGSGGGSGLLGDLMKMALANKGRKNMADIYRENRDYNKMIMDEAYDRSLPWSSQGPAGNVTFDAEGKAIDMELDEDVQAIMDTWLRQGQRAGDELAAFDMEGARKDQIRMFDEANAFRDRQDRQRVAEQNYARGIEGTGAMYANMALGEQVNQRRLQEAIAADQLAMGKRQMLSGESIAQGNAGIDAVRMLMAQGDLSRAVGQGSHTGVNAEGVALGSMALADTKAGYWSGLMGGMANKSSGSPSSSGSGGGFLSDLMKNFSIFT